MSRASTWCVPFLGLAFSSWRQVFNLSVSSRCPAIPHGDAPPGRQRFRRSEIPTCHPGRNGAHNKSDILLVSSSFADPGFPSPVAASFQLAECGHLLLRRCAAGTAKVPSLGDSDLPPRSAWHAQQVGHPPRLLHLCRSRLPFPRGGEFSTCRMRAFTAAAMRRRDGKASVARRFRLATRDGMVRTTSRTSSSSPPPSPIPASLPPWRRVFNLPNAGIYCCGDAPPGRQSFRRSEIPTCHPDRHGTHNKSDILLVSSTFADPGLPSPVAASFQLAECGHLLLRRCAAGTAKLPSLGDSDLPPRSAWHAQQVGHPPRLLHLRRSRLASIPASREAFSSSVNGRIMEGVVSMTWGEA
jgi:hypothetical protein